MNLRLWRQHEPAQSAKGDDPLMACDRAIASVTAKADFNETLSRRATTAIISASALIPVCVIAATQGHEFLWGKLLPALLAAVSAASAGVLQFERPHERWRLYRGYQRRFEDERFRFENGLDPYDELDAPGRLRLLGDTVSGLEMRMHQDWSGLLPASASVASYPHSVARAPGDDPAAS